MKRQIAFNFFAEGQTLFFDIQRLEELETLLGCKLGELGHSVDSIKTLVTGLMVGLKHHYRNEPRSFFQELLDTFLDNGGNIQEIYFAFTRALFITGMFGSELAKAALNAKNEDSFNESVAKATEAVESKNARKAKANP